MKNFRINKQNTFTLGILGAAILLATLGSPSQANDLKIKDSTASAEEKLEEAEMESLLEDIIDDLDNESQEIFGPQNGIRVYGLSNELLVDRENPHKLTRYEREIVRNSDFLMSFNGADFYFSEVQTRFVK